MAERAVEQGQGRVPEAGSWLVSAVQGDNHPLARDLSETVDDFMRVIVAMRHMDDDPAAPRWQAEHATFVALGRLRRSLTRACAARGLD
jgi:hypothetical protein